MSAELINNNTTVFYRKNRGAMLHFTNFFKAPLSIKKGDEFSVIGNKKVTIKSLKDNPTKIDDLKITI